MAFYPCTNDEIYYTKSTVLSAEHAFLTRKGGVSTGVYDSLNLCVSKDDPKENTDENYRRICAMFRTTSASLYPTHQVHGTAVRIVRKSDAEKNYPKTCYEADGLVTAEKGLLLLCYTADCIPLLLQDTSVGVIAAVHCGWRSSVGDIIKNAVEKMEMLGAEPSHIHAAMGPSIRQCCFACDTDVPLAIEKYLSGEINGIFRPSGHGKIMVNLSLANQIRLIQLGLKAENIDISDECTCCLPDRYWSHRFTGGQRGTQGSLILMND